MSPFCRKSFLPGNVAVSDVAFDGVSSAPLFHHAESGYLRYQINSPIQQAVSSLPIDTIMYVPRCTGSGNPNPATWIDGPWRSCRRGPRLPTTHSASLQQI
jgi:hypothetical protein